MNIKNQFTYIEVLIVIVVIGLLSLLVFYVFSNSTNNSGSEETVKVKNKDLSKAKNFRVYYNDVNDTILNEMKNYDVMLVETRNFTREQVNTVQKGNTILLGYISITELGEGDPTALERLNEEDFLEINGVKKDTTDGNFITDITSKHYQQVLMDLIDERIVQKNFDGVFLDTVGFIDYHYSENPEHFEKQRQEYISFLKGLKQTYPELIVMQNQGFETLDAGAYKYVDGFLWEGYNYTNLEQNQWTLDRINMLKKHKVQNEIRTFVIYTENEIENKELAFLNGFVSLYNPYENLYMTWSIDSLKTSTP